MRRGAPRGSGIRDQGSGTHGCLHDARAGVDGLPGAAEVVVGEPRCHASGDRLEPFAAQAVDDVGRAVAEHGGIRDQRSGIGETIIHREHRVRRGVRSQCALHRHTLR
jgi:hypothetical protein